MLAVKSLRARVPDAWQSVLAPFWATPEARQLATFLDQIPAHLICPPAALWFAALAKVAPENAQVVILGQDPYHGPNQAMGLAFSVPHGQPIPPSLRNIFHELGQDLQCSEPTSGNLMPWVCQNVLLLNTTLTVAPGQAGSHAGQGWECLTQLVIRRLFEPDQPRAFLLWGAAAQRQCPRALNSTHLVLTAPHPSPLSAHRGFLGCRHFSQVNRWRYQQGLPELDWAL